MLRESWWPKQCACGAWIGLMLAPDVHDPEVPQCVGVCPACGAAYYLAITAVQVREPAAPAASHR